MALIRKPFELQVTQTTKCLIYGQAGTGKTTLALSAKNPLLIDFDGGVKRVNFAHIKDTVQVSSYSDFLGVLNSPEVSEYDTIVVDTGGKMLDSMADYIIKTNPKMGRSNGMLTQTGYGQRKAEFTNVCRLLDRLQKNIIFVAHRQTEKDGDEVRYVPQFGGSNYDALVTELDFVGYIEANGRQRVITFDATSRNDGKNTIGAPSQIVIDTVVDKNGNPTKENDFFERVIMAYYHESQRKRNEQTAKYNEVCQAVTTAINTINNAEEANMFIENINNYDHIGNSKARASQLLAQRAKELGLVFDKDTKQYK